MYAALRTIVIQHQKSCVSDNTEVVIKMYKTNAVQIYLTLRVQTQIKYYITRVLLIGPTTNEINFNSIYLF